MGHGAGTHDLAGKRLARGTILAALDVREFDDVLARDLKRLQQLAHAELRMLFIEFLPAWFI